MRNVYLLLLASVLFSACGGSKKISPTNTSINNKTSNNTAATNKPAEPEKKEKVNPTGTAGAVAGKWRFESASEKDFDKTDFKVLPELSFNETDRKVTGSTGCNELNGFFFITGNQFNFSPIAVDKKKCIDASLEDYLTNFFKVVGFYKTDKNRLYLFNKNDKDKYLVFSKM